MLLFLMPSEALNTPWVYRIVWGGFQIRGHPKVFAGTEIFEKKIIYSVFDPSSAIRRSVNFSLFKIFKIQVHIYTYLWCFWSVYSEGCVSCAANWLSPHGRSWGPGTKILQTVLVYILSVVTLSTQLAKITSKNLRFATF